MSLEMLLETSLKKYIEETCYLIEFMGYSPKEAVEEVVSKTGLSGVMASSLTDQIFGHKDEIKQAQDRLDRSRKIAKDIDVFG